MSPARISTQALALVEIEDQALGIMGHEAYEAASVEVSDRQRGLLQRWVGKVSETPHRLRERCQIVLLSADKLSNEEQARRLGVDVSL